MYPNPKLGQLLDRSKTKQETETKVKVKMISKCIPNKRNIRKDDLI